MNAGRWGHRIGLLAATCAAMLLVTGCDGGGGGGTDAGPDVLPDVTPDAFDDTPGDIANDRGPDVDDVVDPTALALVASGRELLSAGESLAAIDTFGRALERAPGLPDAQWGLVLARFQANVAMFSSLPGMINFKDDPDAPAQGVLPIAAWPTHPGTVGTAIDALHAAALAQKERLDALKALPGNPVFHLEGGLPLAFGDHPMMNLCCSWDRSELHGISAFNHMMFALVALLGSQDTDVNLLTLETMMDDRGLVATLAGILDESPKAFTLLPEGGADTWRSIKAEIAGAADDTLAAADSMAEDNGLEDNVATLTTTAHRHLLLHGSFPSGKTELEVLWDGDSASLKATVEKVKAHLAGDATARLSLEGDVLTALGTLVDVVNRTVGINTVATSLGFKLPDLVTGMLDSLDPEDPEQLVPLLGSLLPLLGLANGTIQFDLLALLDTPFNLRDFFPNWGSVPDAEWPAFLRSYECLKGGATLTNATLTFTFHDASATVTPAVMLVQSFATADGKGDPLDTEHGILAARGGFTEIFTALVPVAEGDTATDDDGTLILPAGGSAYATWTAANGTSTLRFGGNTADGFAPYVYADACPDTTTAWDGPHFGETEFADAVEVSAPGQTSPLGAIAADGTASLQGHLAFRSPSLGGLLWIDRGTGLAPADQVAINGFINAIFSKLGAL
jgi:hypothetical protein